MNLTFLLLLIFQSFTVNSVPAPSTPPSVSVKLTGPEQFELMKARQAVSDAEATLAKAKSDQESIEGLAIKAHWPKELPHADCLADGMGGLFLSWGQPYVAPKPTKYLGAVNNDWAVYSLGFQTCRGM